MTQPPLDEVSARRHVLNLVAGAAIVLALLALGVLLFAWVRSF